MVLAALASAVIFGGPQSANDDDEIVKREIDWIGVALKDEEDLTFISGRLDALIAEAAA